VYESSWDIASAAHFAVSLATTVGRRAGPATAAGKVAAVAWSIPALLIFASAVAALLGLPKLLHAIAAENANGSGGGGGEEELALALRRFDSGSFGSGSFDSGFGGGWSGAIGWGEDAGTALGWLLHSRDVSSLLYTIAFAAKVRSTGALLPRMAPRLSFLKLFKKCVTQGQPRPALCAIHALVRPPVPTFRPFSLHISPPRVLAGAQRREGRRAGPGHTARALLPPLLPRRGSRC